MTLLVPLAMFGWLPCVLLLFACLPPRRAVIAAFLAAWLFLPNVVYRFGDATPDYDKMSATCIGVLLGTLIFDVRRFVRMDLRWLDIPMLIWCLCPIASSLANGLGLYDGLSTAFRNAVIWGMPYFIGRAYFRTVEDLKELAIGIFIGGLAYAPLCLWEMRMSPQLSHTIYGIDATFYNVRRWGGWRPQVFMADGLMLGMWMCMAALIGYWLRVARAVPRAWHSVSTGFLVVVLFVTSILCRSTGATVLMLSGMLLLLAVWRLGWRWTAWLAILAAPLYVAVRAPGLWDAKAIVDLAACISPARADSIGVRLANEDMLAAKASERLLFGWGGWGRNRVYNEVGKDITLTDGLWIITLGRYGVVGLAFWLLAMLLPSSLVVYRTHPRGWRDRENGAAVALACVVIMYVLDCIPNAMVNPVFGLVAGGLVGPVGARPASRTGKNGSAVVRREQSSHRQCSEAVSGE